MRVTKQFNKLVSLQIRMMYGQPNQCLEQNKSYPSTRAILIELDAQQACIRMIVMVCLVGDKHTKAYNVIDTHCSGD